MRKSARHKKSNNIVIKTNFDTSEALYKEHFIRKYPELIEFTIAAGNLCYTYLSGLEGTKALNESQQACIFLIGKAQRLLRSIFNTCKVGNWPEAIPEKRAMFEAFMVMEYILMDVTGKRAKKWLERAKNSHWPMAELIKDKGLLSDIYSKAYSNLSFNPHSHASSFGAYLKFTDEGFSFRTGPLWTDEDDEQAEQIIALAARRAVSFCEISRTVFPPNEDWEKQHKQLMKLPHIKKHFAKAKKIMENNDELRYDFTQHMKKIQGI